MANKKRKPGRQTGQRSRRIGHLDTDKQKTLARCQERYILIMKHFTKFVNLRSNVGVR